MNIPYVIWNEEDGFVIRSLQYPVTTQGDTKEDAITSLQEAVELYLEDLPKSEGWRPAIANVELGDCLIHA